MALLIPADSRRFAQLAVLQYEFDVAGRDRWGTQKFQRAVSPKNPTERTDHHLGLLHISHGSKWMK
jgi:hypothetical protein